MSASTLTHMQRRYIWLAGSHPNLMLMQGRGYRSPRTAYGIDQEAGELVVFGYSNPPMWMVRRGLLRAGQAPRSFVLTDQGEAAFRQLLITGAGMNINKQIREVKLAPRQLRGFPND